MASRVDAREEREENVARIQIGMRLVKFRDDLGLRHKAMSELLDISPQRLTNYESGQRPLPMVLVRRMRQHWPWLDVRWLLALD